MSTMRVSELLGRKVLDAEGRHAGRVQDVVAVAAPGGGLEVEGLVLGRSALAGRLGYGGTLAPPTPLDRVLRLLRRHERYVLWEDVESVARDPIRVGVLYAQMSHDWHPERRE